MEIVPDTVKAWIADGRKPDPPSRLPKFHRALVDWYIALQPAARINPNFLTGGDAFKNLRAAATLSATEYQHLRSVEPNGFVLVLRGLSWSFAPTFMVSRGRGLSDVTPLSMIEDFTQVLRMLAKQ